MVAQLDTGRPMRRFRVCVGVAHEEAAGGMTDYSTLESWTGCLQIATSGCWRRSKVLRWRPVALVDTNCGCRNMVKRCTSAGVLGSAGVSCNRKKTTNDASVKGASEVLVIHQLISGSCCILHSCLQVTEVVDTSGKGRLDAHVRWGQCR